MWSPLDAGRAAAPLPEGLAPGSDPSLFATGTLVGLNTADWLAQVSVGGSSPVWVPADPAIYTQGGLVRVMRSPLDRGRVVYCLRPLTDAVTVVKGVVTAVNAGAGTLTVTTLGGSHELPYVAGTYAVNSVVHVKREPSRWGAPEIVLGLQGNFGGSDPDQPGGGQSNPAGTVRREKTIVPQWSGSYRAGYGWDRWNADRDEYGGRSTLWQGNQWGSGDMIGLATVGDQIENLDATQIDDMKVRVYRADSSTTAGRQVVVQGSPHGSKPAGAPSGSGATVTGPSLTPGKGATLTLPGSIYDDFRTGAKKGLVVVGSQYSAWRGTSKADGMAITVQYRVSA